MLRRKGHGAGWEKGWGNAACLAAHIWAKEAGQVTPSHIWKEGQGESEMQSDFAIISQCVCWHCPSLVVRLSRSYSSIRYCRAAPGVLHHPECLLQGSGRNTVGLSVLDSVCRPPVCQGWFIFCVANSLAQRMS